jgi:endonuclease/exonuclease/phosphatase family metal-dependent hydrolase
MRFRAVTLNMEQDHKRWDLRRELIAAQLCQLKPDIFAMNEVCIPRQTARWLQSELKARTGADYALVQQTKVNGLATVDGEALLTRFPIVETGNLDYQAHDMVALVARVILDGKPVDVYVTHLYRSLGEDALRLYQVQQLLAWIDSRPDAAARIVCGDFNAPPDMPSATLMATRHTPTQTAPTAPTPLAGANGEVSHPHWPRMKHCIDYIWTAGALKVVESGVCFDRPSPTDPSLWPSDHAGVWADLELGSV